MAESCLFSPYTRSSKYEILFLDRHSSACVYGCVSVYQCTISGGRKSSSLRMLSWSSCKLASCRSRWSEFSDDDDMTMKGIVIVSLVIFPFAVAATSSSDDYSSVAPLLLQIYMAHVHDIYCLVVRDILPNAISIFMAQFSSHLFSFMWRI